MEYLLLRLNGGWANAIRPYGQNHHCLLHTLIKENLLNLDLCTTRKITCRQFNRLLQMVIMPLIAMTTLLLLCAPAAGFELKKISVSDAAAKQNSLIFLDGRPVKEFQAGHIPGARSFSWETYTRTDENGVPYRTFPPEELADALGEMGISSTDALVVYGDADTSWGGEGWVAWVLAWLGHQGPVYALDGGIPLWLAKDYPVVKSEKTDFPEKTYSIHLQPDQNMTAEDIAKAGDTVTLVDTRKYLTEYLPGHLPDAVHIPWEKFYYGDHRQFISPENVKVLLTKRNVDLEKPVVYYCTGGIRSGYAWMVHQLAGLPDAVNFEGGTEEWNRMRRPKQ